MLFVSYSGKIKLLNRSLQRYSKLQMLAELLDDLFDKLDHAVLAKA